MRSLHFLLKAVDQHPSVFLPVFFSFSFFNLGLQWKRKHCVWSNFYSIAMYSQFEGKLIMREMGGKFWKPSSKNSTVRFPAHMPEYFNTTVLASADRRLAGCCCCCLTSHRLFKTVWGSPVAFWANCTFTTSDVRGDTFYSSRSRPALFSDGTRHQSQLFLSCNHVWLYLFGCSCVFCSGISPALFVHILFSFLFNGDLLPFCSLSLSIMFVSRYYPIIFYLFFLFSQMS